MAANGMGIPSSAQWPRDARRQQDVVLAAVRVDELKTLRFDFKRQSYPLSTNAIDQIVREISVHPLFTRGSSGGDERIYNALTLGVTVTEFIDGKKHSPTIPSSIGISLEECFLLRRTGVVSSDATHTSALNIVGYVMAFPWV